MQISIISFSDLATDGRVLRQIEYLSPHYEVDVVAYGKLPKLWSPAVRYSPIQPPTSGHRRLRKALLLPAGRVSPQAAYEKWYWQEREYQEGLETLIKTRADAIHANDWEALPIAVKAAEETGAIVVADLHEYAPALRENRRYWRLFFKPSIEYFLRTYLPKATATITVNQTIADRYRAEYGVHPLVVMNAPKPKVLPPFRPTDPEKIRLIHHGHANRDRNLELMIELMPLLESRYELHLMLLDRTRGYLSELQELVSSVAPERITFHEPVAPQDIVTKIAEFDMGIYFLEAKSFNQVASLPNKFFEYIVAGLALCIGPSPEMQRLIEEHGCGVVSPSLTPEAIAQKLNSLDTDSIDQLKQRSITARTILNADTELGKLVDLYARLLAEQ